MTNNIIDSLVEDLQPVTRLHLPAIRFMKLVVGVAAIIAVMATMYDTNDIVARFSNNEYLIALFLIVGAGMSSLLAAFKLSIPDENYNKLGYVLLTISGLLWAVLYYLVLSSITLEMVIVELNHAAEDITSICGFTLLGTVTTAIAVAMVRKAAPVNRLLASVSVLAGGFSFSIISCHLMHGTGGVHVFVWQLLPILALGFVGFLAGKNFFK